MSRLRSLSRRNGKSPSICSTAACLGCHTVGSPATTNSVVFPNLDPSWLVAASATFWMCRATRQYVIWNDDVLDVAELGADANVRSPGSGLTRGPRANRIPSGYG